MNLNKNITSDSEFSSLYGVIYREFQKIANNKLCNALSAYNNIFVISISEGNYSDKLYWLIGDFLFACAKERRSNILKATDWLRIYCYEFEEYSKCLHSINALCSFLNEILIKNSKGRRIDEFGFLLWERCVIQQMECAKRYFLGDEMLRQIENNHTYFKSALISLKMIVPNPEEPLYFYKLIYEDNALKYLAEKYKNKIVFSSFDDLILQIEDIFSYEKSRMGLVFLEESYPAIWKLLESILICDNHSFIYTSLYQCLKTDLLGLGKYYHRLSAYSNEFVWCCKEVMRSYIRSNYANDIKDIHAANKDQVIFFQHFYSRISSANKIINSCFSGVNLCDDIFTEKCEQLKSPDFNERLIAFSTFVLESDEYDTLKQVLYESLRFIANKSRFSELYFEVLRDKLLEFRFNHEREADFIKYLKPFVEPQFHRKYCKMIKDMDFSIFFNNNKVLITENKNDMESFVTILDYSAWTFEEKDLLKEIVLPLSFESHKDWAISKYNTLYPERTLIWMWDKGHVLFSLETNKTYEIKMNIYQYVIFNTIYLNDGVTETYVVEAVKLRREDVGGIIYALIEHKLVICKDEIYWINSDFSSDETFLSFENMIHVRKTKNEQMIDLKLYYKAKIVRILKKCKKIERDELELCIISEHIEEEKYNGDFLATVLDELENNGYIEINNNTILYEP